MLEKQEAAIQEGVVKVKIKEPKTTRTFKPETIAKKAKTAAQRTGKKAKATPNAAPAAAAKAKTTRKSRAAAKVPAKAAKVKNPKAAPKVEVGVKATIAKVTKTKAAKTALISTDETTITLENNTTQPRGVQDLNHDDVSLCLQNAFADAPFSIERDVREKPALDDDVKSERPADHKTAPAPASSEPAPAGEAPQRERPFDAMPFMMPWMRTGLDLSRAMVRAQIQLSDTVLGQTPAGAFVRQQALYQHQRSAMLAMVQVTPWDFWLRLSR